MKKDEIIRRLRRYLHDPDGKVWRQDELADLVANAARAYSVDTGAFRGDFFPLADAAGCCSLPGDCIGFVAAWNREGYRVEPISLSELRRRIGDFSRRSGPPNYLCGDLDGNGAARLVPNPAAAQNDTRLFPDSPFGTAAADGHGVPDRSAGYGVPVMMTSFIPQCEVKYIRLGEPEEIRDHLAVIWHAAGQAFAADSDFRDPERAANFFAWYRRRIARIEQTKNHAPRLRRSGTFY